MSNKKKKRVNKKIQENNRKSKFLLIFVCIFLAIILALALIFGISSAIKKARAAAMYKNVYMDTEVVAFFLSRYKSIYMTSLSAAGVQGVEDAPGFWNKVAEGEKTYGDLLIEGGHGYIRGVIIGNYIFDKYASLTDEDKRIIEDAIADTVTYKAGGSKAEFNKATKEYGFSYGSYCDAVEMLYKSSLAQAVVCGEDGENLKDGAAVGDYITAGEYLSEYTHIKLLFIRTETAFATDESGNRLEQNGGYVIRELTAEEKLARAELIEEIRTYIAAIGSGDAQMGPDMFSYYLANHDEGDPDMRNYGYYLHERSEFTAAFLSEYANIAEKAEELEIGEFGEVDVEFGRCFIYRTDTDEADLGRSALSVCFGDFYSNMADVFFAELVADMSPEVDLTDKVYGIDMLVQPYNYIYTPSFS